MNLVPPILALSSLLGPWLIATPTFGADWPSDGELDGVSGAGKTVSSQLHRPNYPNLRKVEISFDLTTAAFNYTFPPMLAEPLKYGDQVFIKAYVYPEGTWAIHCPGTNDCGVNPTGGAEFPGEQIGEMICNGTFFADPFAFKVPEDLGKEVGLFFLNIDFGEGDVVELRGRTRVGQQGSNPAPFSVLGGTGRLKKARGQAMEAMMAPNAACIAPGMCSSNFKIDLSGLVLNHLGQEWFRHGRF